MTDKRTHSLTVRIVLAMLLGLVFGLIINLLPKDSSAVQFIARDVLDLGGKIFLNSLKMLVVPIVFISLVCGTFNLDSELSFGRIASRTVVLYLLTTAIAISLALCISSLLNVGNGSHLVSNTQYTAQAMPSLKQTILNIFPANPVKALAEGNMLQIIVFSILLGIAITWSGTAGEQIKDFFRNMDVVVMNLMAIVIKIAPFGVFCLVAAMFAKLGIGLIAMLAGYFFTVLLALFLQLVITYSGLLYFYGGLHPLYFFKHLLPAMLFAFSTASSSASIPVVLSTVEEKCGVKESISSFVIPLGATINMDGTAIMQGVATVFIANTYSIKLGLVGFLKVILTATLASIGTAGVPGVGLITLTMVLMQVGLPIDGIALIIGVDRLLDMARTAVNVAGDSMVACVVAVKEKQINLTTFNHNHLS